MTEGVSLSDILKTCIVSVIGTLITSIPIIYLHSIIISVFGVIFWFLFGSNLMHQTYEQRRGN